MLVLTSTPGADWLPPGGRADVFLVQPGDTPPDPVGLVRLLLTDAAGRLFLVPRTGGRPGLDLPTAPVPDGASPATALTALVGQVVGGAAPTELVGYVRNTVPEATSYEWPAPVAHFCVHHVVGAAHPAAGGVWLDRAAASAELAERHWWPLVAVGHEEAVKATEDLSMEAGLWLDSPPGDREGTIRVATDALVAGLDSPSLRLLAGLDRDAGWAQVQEALRGVVAELALPEPTLEGAIRIGLERRCRAVLDGTAEARELAFWAWEWDGVPRRPAVLDPFVAASWEYDYLDDLSEHLDPDVRTRSLAELDEVVRRAARDVVRDR